MSCIDWELSTISSTSILLMAEASMDVVNVDETTGSTGLIGRSRQPSRAPAPTIVDAGTTRYASRRNTPRRRNIEPFIRVVPFAPLALPALSAPPEPAVREATPTSRSPRSTLNVSKSPSLQVKLMLKPELKLALKLALKLRQRTHGKSPQP